MENCGPKILVTGAAGYIGSHSIVLLLEAGYNVVALDNCSNSIQLEGEKFPESLLRVQRITGRKIAAFYEVDLTDKGALGAIFSQHQFDAVMHFASMKAVGESCRIPLDYYRNNVGGTLNLLEVMSAHNCKRLIFSSSATVYGTPECLPIKESHPTGVAMTNPYGRTKYFLEEIIQDLCRSDEEWSVMSLRYFNPVGAHESGEIGEDPNGIPNNLMPYISQVAVGRQPFFRVFGADFQTPDGTGIRDYIHIMDLASGHATTLKKLLEDSPLYRGWNVFNLGCGAGHSVLDVLSTFEKASGIKIPYKIVERRPGDVQEAWADVTKIQRELGWKPTKTLLEMCEDTWRWQSKNPMGYRKELNNNDAKMESLQ